MNEEVMRLAQVVWDYHCLRQQPEPADVIIALGSHDLRVAEFAADLYRRGYGSWLLCTGGIAHQGDLLATPWHKSEAEMFADVAVHRDVPRHRILLETKATNTAENLRLGRELLAERGLEPRNIVIVVKPFMLRRAWATREVV